MSNIRPFSAVAGSVLLALSLGACSQPEPQPQPQVPDPLQPFTSQTLT